MTNLNLDFNLDVEVEKHNDKNEILKAIRSYPSGHHEILELFEALNGAIVKAYVEIAEKNTIQFAERLAKEPENRQILAEGFVEVGKQRGVMIFGKVLDNFIKETLKKLDRLEIEHDMAISGTSEKPF